MKAIKAKIENVNICISSSLLSLLEKKTEEEQDEEVSLYYDDFDLHTIDIIAKGFVVKYVNKGGQTIYGHIKFKDLVKAR